MQIGGMYTIDFAKVSKIPKFEVTIKNGDSKRTIKLILLKNSEVLNLNNYTVVVAAKKIDGKYIFNDVKTIDAESGICEVEITEQMLALDMDLPCEIVVYGPDGVVASSSNFVISKISSLKNEETIVSSDEFKALTKALSRVQYLENKTATKSEVNIERKRIDLLTKVENGQTQGNTELLDIRVGEDGIEYETAGNSIRNQFNSVSAKIGNLPHEFIRIDITENQSNGAARGSVGETLRIETQTYYQNTFVDCRVGDIFEVTLKKSTAVNNDGMIHLVDDNLNIIALEIPWDGISEIITKTIIIPDGTTKLNICSYSNVNTFTTDVKCLKRKYIPLTHTIQELDTKLGVLEKSLVDIDITENRRDGAIRGTIGSVLRFETQTYYQNTYINCIAGDSYRIKTKRPANSEIEGYVFFCDNLNNIIDIQIPPNTGVADTIEQDVVVPDKAIKMYILGYTNSNNFYIDIVCKKYITKSFSEQVRDIDIKINNEVSKFNKSLNQISNELDTVVNNNYNPNILFISRQGEIGGYPENSLYGIKCAYDNGYKNIRVSINLTSDGIPVLMHDYTINRLARNMDGSIISDTLYIRNLTLDQVNSYDWGRISNKPELYGLNITTLDEFIKFSKYAGIKIRLELKEDYTSENIDTILNILIKYGMLEYTTFSTDIKSVLDIISTKCKCVNLALIGHFRVDLVDQVSSYKNELNKINIDIYKDDFDLLTTKDLLYAKNKGVSIKVGSATTLEDLYKWAESGIDALEVAYISYPAKKIIENYMESN